MNASGVAVASGDVDKADKADKAAEGKTLAGAGGAVIAGVDGACAGGSVCVGLGTEKFGVKELALGLRGEGTAGLYDWKPPEPDLVGMVVGGTGVGAAWLNRAPFGTSEWASGGACAAGVDATKVGAEKILVSN